MTGDVYQGFLQASAPMSLFATALGALLGLIVGMIPGMTISTGIIIVLPLTFVLPPDISIWEAAAPPQSLGFALVGALLIIPFILMYTAFAYYVFRGKVRPGDGYH